MRLRRLRTGLSQGKKLALRARRFASRIWIRLLAFNLLLVFLPLFILPSLKVYEGELLKMQERSMVQQGRVLAAALGSTESLDQKEAERILKNMRQAFDARLRVIDPAYNVIADSSLQGPRAEGEEGAPAALDTEVRRNPLYQVGSFLYRTASRWFLSPPEVPAEDDGLTVAGRHATREVREALAGNYGKSIRPSPSGQRSLTLNSALPIRDGEQVIGVVLVSRSTFLVLGLVHTLRLDAFKILLASVVVAVVLSLLVSTTINRPLVRLREEAQAILDRRGRLQGAFSVSQRLDEIGDLNRALAELTRRLEGHLRFIESFASDVSHELKNPLAAIRNATELLVEVEEPAEQERFYRMIQDDIQRLERLISGVREISQLDARANERPFEVFDLSATLRGLIERLEMAETRGVRLRLAVDGPIEISARPGRMVQVFENLISNAISFSADGEEVVVEASSLPDRVLVRVSDAGPGIPEEHLEKIFERFFTYRPQEKRARSTHTGLGLAIVKAIVENHGGRVSAYQREDRPGAVFEVELPLHDFVRAGTQALPRIDVEASSV